MKNLRGRIAAAIMAGALITGTFVAPASATADTLNSTSSGTAASLQTVEKQYQKDDHYIQVSHWKYDSKHKKWHRTEHYKHSHHNWAAKYAADKCHVKYNWAHKKSQHVEKHNVKHWSDICTYQKHNTWYQVRYADNNK